MTQDKQQQREFALARRDGIAQDVRRLASQALCAYADLLIALAPYGRIIAGFWPIRSEIDPRPLMLNLAQKGKALALPALIAQGQDRQMVFRAFEPGQELVEQEFATFAPREEATIIEPEIILLPLAAFDVQGNRLGYGGGFYDRSLAQMHERGLAPKLVGLAFDCQEVAVIAAEPHDIRLEAVLTESGLRQFGKWTKN